MNLLLVDTNSRINDWFVTSNRINCTYPAESLWTDLIPASQVAGSTLYRTDFYSKIALDVVTETVFNYPYPYISEKTLRPIACKRMFIIIGAADTLAILKIYGFKTWSDLIDESYDSISDPEERFLSVIESVNNFCKLSLTDVKQFLLNNQDRLDHNFQVLQSLKTQEVSKLRSKLKGI